MNFFKEERKLYLIIITIINTLNIPANVRSEDEFCPNNQLFMCEDQNSYYTCENANDGKTVKTKELKQCDAGLTCDVQNDQACVEYCPKNGPFVCQDEKNYYLCDEYFNNTTIKNDVLKRCELNLICDMNAEQQCIDPALRPPPQCKDNEAIIESTCGTVELIIQMGEGKCTLTVDESTQIVIATTDTGTCETSKTPNGETSAKCTSSTATW